MNTDKLKMKIEKARAKLYLAFDTGKPEVILRASRKLDKLIVEMQRRLAG